MADHNEAKFAVGDGTELYYQSWTVDEPTEIVVCVHGLGEHSGRYAHVAAFFNDLGCSVYAPDLRGHGQSSGKRGHVKRFREYITDLDEFTAMVLKTTGRQKCYLLGHSLGGLIGLAYALDHPERLLGAIISSPLLKVKVPLPKGKILIGKIFSVLAPKLSVTNEIDPKYLSHDPAVVQGYVDDPLVHNLVTTRFYTELLKSLATTNARAGEFKVPLLLIPAGDDMLVDPDQSRVFFDALTVADKQFKRFDGFYHEIFNEVEKEQVFTVVREWLEPRLGK